MKHHKQNWCLGHTLINAEVIGQGCGLGGKGFKSSPGDFNREPRFPSTALGMVSLSGSQNNSWGTENP